METPKHYQSKIEPIDFILANDLNFIEGNIIKYVARYKKKNGLEDLLKAKDCLEKLINEVKNEKNKATDNNKENTTIYNIAKYTYETTICYSRLGCNWELYLFKINEELEFYFLKKIEVFNGHGFIGVEFNKDFFERFVYDNIELKKITYENIKFINHSEKLDTGGYMFETDNKIFILKPNENNFDKTLNEVKNEKNKVIDNSKKNITTYNITNESDIIGNIYDHEHDFSVWVVKVSEKEVLAFLDKQKSREIVVKILEKEKKLYSKNIFIPETIKVFYEIDRADFAIARNGEFWKFKTTDGIININYNYEN